MTRVLLRKARITKKERRSYFHHVRFPQEFHYKEKHFGICLRYICGQVSIYRGRLLRVNMLIIQNSKFKI